MRLLIDRLSSNFLPSLLAGMTVNFEIAGIALTLGLALGVPLAFARLRGGVAGMAAGMFLVASYFITALAQINSGLKPIARFSPLEYYQSGYAVRGLKPTWLGGLLVVASLLAVVAGWRFERRDIRVAGEGSWRWPWQRRKTAGAKNGRT